MDEIKVASTLICKDNTFLLIKANRGAGKGLWNNPGGRLEIGEPFEECAVRETLEETGFKIRLGHEINSFVFEEGRGKKVLKKVYEAIIIEGALHFPLDEIEEARWFTKEELTEKLLFTEGALLSIEDFSNNIRGRVYYTNRIA